MGLVYKVTIGDEKNKYPVEAGDEARNIMEKNNLSADDIEADGIPKQKGIEYRCGGYNECWDPCNAKLKLCRRKTKNGFSYYFRPTVGEKHIEGCNEKAENTNENKIFMLNFDLQFPIEKVFDQIIGERGKVRTTNPPKFKTPKTVIELYEVLNGATVREDTKVGTGNLRIIDVMINHLTYRSYRNNEQIHYKREKKLVVAQFCQNHELTVRIQAIKQRNLWVLEDPYPGLKEKKVYYIIEFANGGIRRKVWREYLEKLSGPEIERNLCLIVGNWKKIDLQSEGFDKYILLHCEVKRTQQLHILKSTDRINRELEWIVP